MHGANLQVDFGISEKRLTTYTLDLKGMQKMAISSYERGKHGTNVIQLLDFEIEGVPKGLPCTGEILRSVIPDALAGVLRACGPGRTRPW